MASGTLIIRRQAVEISGRFHVPVEQLDPTDVRAILNPYYETAKACRRLGRCAGRPSATRPHREDDPARVPCRSALAIAPSSSANRIVSSADLLGQPDQ